MMTTADSRWGECPVHGQLTMEQICIYGLPERGLCPLPTRTQVDEDIRIGVCLEPLRRVTNDDG